MNIFKDNEGMHAFQYKISITRPTSKHIDGLIQDMFQEKYNMSEDEMKINW